MSTTPKATTSSAHRPLDQHLDHADLFFERDDVLGKEPHLLDRLQRQDGIYAAQVIPHADPSLEVCVRVDFDPSVTNPVILKESLAREGFTVLSAAEHP